MRKIIAFSNLTLDGFFAGPDGDISWTRREIQDPEWNTFVNENAKGGSTLVFGRKTYELMASYWPTPMAATHNPIVAERMNILPKIVFSRSLDSVGWRNTNLLKGDLVTDMRRLKEQEGGGMAILGSGSIVSQLAQTGLIDEFQVVVNPVVIGTGKSLFAGVDGRLNLKLISSRVFENGNTLLCYEPLT
jgi:dihydrofolate reductase